MISEDTLAKFLEAWQDGGLSSAEQSELLLQLDADAGLRRRFAEQVALLGAVRAAADENPRWLALFDLIEQDVAAESVEKLSFEEATMEWIAPQRRRAWHELPLLRALAAAVILLLAASFFMNPRGKETSIAAPVPPPVSAVAVPLAVSAVAVVIGASPEAAMAAGAYLKPGPITQDRGWLTLQTLNGVSVTLDAPFRAELLDHDRVRLDEGRARVRVPEGAEGFRLTSPTFDVVDLGTEFAAKVNNDGTGTCRVFEGKADVSLLDSLGEVKRARRLTANESVQVDPSKLDLGTIQESNADYPEIKKAPRTMLVLPPAYASEVMALHPAGYWRFEEIRDHVVTGEVPGGLRLQAAGTAAITQEGGGNHSGALIRSHETEFFQIPTRAVPLLGGDFSISLFAQFEWLQNFVLFSAARYDSVIQGDAFTLQSYASFRDSGLNGTGLHAVLRDPPAWDGGTEVYGNTLLRPQYWHHIAATRKAGQLTLYLDGAVVGSEFVGAIPLDYRQIYIGRLNANPSQSRVEARGLVGHIDELAVFSRALTDEEIRNLAITAK